MTCSYHLDIPKLCAEEGCTLVWGVLEVLRVSLLSKAPFDSILDSGCIAEVVVDSFLTYLTTFFSTALIG
jgi:hypothetical protein